MLRRILLAEDQEKSFVEWQEALEGDPNIKVDTVAEGARALAALAEQSYSIFLLDLHLPGLRGLALVEEIQKQNLPVAVIVLAGHGSIDQAALVAGPDSERAAHEQTGGGGPQADDERQARAPEDARQDVTSEVVRAHPVRQRRWFEPLHQVLLGRIERREGRQHHGDEAHQRERQRRVRHGGTQARNPRQGRKAVADGAQATFTLGSATP